MWNFFKQRVSMLDPVVLSDEFLNGFRHPVADCSRAALVGQWYRRFSTRPSARAPDYPREFLALARTQGEIAR